MQFPIVLFVDGHSTHLTFNLSKLCYDLKIILIALYPNSTRILQPADVSAFKPIKNGWKKALMEWRRTHLEQNLTKTDFAPILKIVLDKYVSKEIIRSGFRASGLFPWNADAIDYTKCLGKRNAASEPRAEMFEKNIKSLNFNDFCEIVGDKKLQEIQETTDCDDKSNDFKIIFNIYKNFFSNNESDTAEHTPHAAENKCLAHPATPTPIENYADDSDININNMEIIFDGILVPQSEVTVLNNTRSTTDLQKQNAAVPSPELVFVQKPSPLAQTLVWPKTPERKGKRNCEKLPSVITSRKWQEIQENKIATKRNLEAKKMENRKKREVKKFEAQAKVSSGTINKNKRKTSRKTKDTKRKSLNRKDENDKPSSSRVNVISNEIVSFHLQQSANCCNLQDTISMNINENILKEVNNNINDTDPVLSQSSDSEESKLEEPMEEFLPKCENSLSEKGLCFKCTLSLSYSKKGIKCLTCNRHFHLNCITIPDDNLYQCDTCIRNRKHFL